MHLLQIEQLNVLGDILKVGGILSFVLAVGLIAVWKEKNEYKKALADLNASIRKDNIDNIKIIDKLENTIRDSGDNSERILRVTEETLHILKSKLEKVR